MGLFGDGGDDNNQSQQLIEEQIAENKAELENKRRNLYETRLDIIKGQGGQSWTPKVESASSAGGTNTNTSPGFHPFGFKSDKGS